MDSTKAKQYFMKKKEGKNKESNKKRTTFTIYEFMHV
jgi:hypothetical protein